MMGTVYLSVIHMQVRAPRLFFFFFLVTLQSAALPQGEPLLRLIRWTMSGEYARSCTQKCVSVAASFHSMTISHDFFCWGLRGKKKKNTPADCCQINTWWNCGKMKVGCSSACGFEVAHTATELILFICLFTLNINGVMWKSRITPTIVFAAWYYSQFPHTVQRHRGLFSPIFRL